MLSHNIIHTVLCYSQYYSTVPTLLSAYCKICLLIQYYLKHHGAVFEGVQGSLPHLLDELFLLNHVDEGVDLHGVGLPEFGIQLEPAECIERTEDVLVGNRGYYDVIVVIIV